MKMNISWSFTYNSFVKFHGSHNVTVLYPNFFYMEAALYIHGCKFSGLFPNSGF